jgi:hypothetical protein
MASLNGYQSQVHAYGDSLDRMSQFLYEIKVSEAMMSS